MYGYIYLTTNLINGKQYIGKHKSETFDEKYNGSGILIHRAINKHGRENFETVTMIVVSGRLQIRSWTDKEGNKRKSAEIVADNVYFGESKKKETTNPYNTPTSTPTSFGNYIYPAASEFSMFDDDDAQLPF